MTNLKQGMIKRISQIVVVAELEVLQSSAEKVNKKKEQKLNKLKLLAALIQ
jgi:hypothetical protein